MNMNPETTEGQTLKRLALIILLRKGAAEAYEQAHREVWPKMREMLRHGGITKYSIFHLDNLLFLTPKTLDFWPLGVSLTITL